jgi:zinc protease
MIVPIRVLRAAVCLLPLLLLPAAPAPAQPAASKAAAATPWLYRNSDVPQDKEWVFGELPNGVRYAVRNNGVPPGQVSIRVLMDVGSLYERKGEEGYAHLLEHLVFRQSKYLGVAEAIPTWQRLGATFGSDTNAETSPTQTVYKLDLPQATPAALSESFKLLSGMMIAPTLSQANVRAEVPIVLAEKRERGGAAERVADATRQTFYAGQLLATRSPIGTVESLQGANQASVRAFHARWYRPERAVIVAVGDVDPARLASEIAQWFGNWPTTGPAAPPPSFGDPVAPRGSDPANPVGEVKVLVEPDLPRTINYAIMRPWRQVNDTIVYNQGLMIDSLSQALINRRLEARARAGGSFLVAQVGQQDVSRSVDGTFVSVTPLDDNWEAALRDVRAVIADALTTPPTQEEIDREVAEMNIAFLSTVEQRELQPGSKLADDLVTAVDIRETIASPETVHGIFRQSIPLFTPQAVLEHTRTLFTGTVSRAVLLTPQAGPGEENKLRQALLTPVTADSSARLAAKSISFDTLPPIGPPGKLAAATPTGVLGIEQIELSNGIKALIWPSKDEPGRVAVKVRFGAGYRAFAPGDAPYIELGEMALVGSGQGELGQEELDRLSTGRKMGFDFAIEDSAFEFSANTRPADLADQLYLFAAKFAAPRWDPNPVVRAKAAARLQYESFGTSPQGVLQRDLQFYQRGRDPRFHMPTPRELEAATPAGFRQVWEPILRTGPIELQVYGDIDRAGTIAALERTFGALPPRSPLPSTTAPATAVVPAASTTPISVTHRGDPNQAAAVISWPTGGGMVGVRESRQLEILSQLFGNRLLDRMREKLGASYAPQVASSWPVDLDKGGAIYALAQLQPSAIPVFFATAEEIAADLIANPPSADELERVTEPLRQQISRASTGAAFFMYQLEGATADPSRFGAVRTLLTDYTRTTPQAMQALARRYLAPGKSWRLAVVPEANVRPAAANGR